MPMAWEIFSLSYISDMLFLHPSMNDRVAGDTLDELIAGSDHSSNGLHVVSCISVIIIIIIRSSTNSCSSIQCNRISKINLN